MSAIKNSIFKISNDISPLNIPNPLNTGNLNPEQSINNLTIDPFKLFATVDSASAQKEATTTLKPNADIASVENTQAWNIAITKSQEKLGTYRGSLQESHSFTNDSSTPNFIQDGITGENQGFSGIPNDGKSDPLYDASKHTQEENQKISNMMTIVNSSQSSEVSNATSSTGEYFTHEFSKGILDGRSLQDVIKSLDGKNLKGAQTSVAYNTENMSEGEISSSNKANGTAIILRGSNDGVGDMMAKDEANLKQAYSALGLEVKVVHSEKEFEQALLAAKDKAVADKAQGKESILATHVISHGLQAGGTKGADANSALAMQGGGLYQERDIIGDIAGALEPGENGESAFKHSYNAFTACHSGGFDNEQTLVAASKPKEEQPTS
jgi:hypothetical protein